MAVSKVLEASFRGLLDQLWSISMAVGKAGDRVHAAEMTQPRVGANTEQRGLQRQGGRKVRGSTAREPLRHWAQSQGFSLSPSRAWAPACTVS